MDELLASVEDMVNHLNYAMYVEPIGTTPFPIAKLQRIGRAWLALKAAQVAHKCAICRVEAMPGAGMTCAKCKVLRSPNPPGHASWEIVA